MEMADSGLSTSSWAFNELCRPKLHGKNVKPHMVGPIFLHGERDVHSGNMRYIAYYGGQLLPIPSTPPPDYIIGFKRIRITFLDDRMLEFIKCISPKLNGIKFKMEMNFEKWKLDKRDERSRAIQCLLNMLAGRIAYLFFDWPGNIKMFNSHFPDFINKCQCLRICYYIEFRKPEFDFDVVFEWLTNRQQMDANATKQKILMSDQLDNELAYFIRRIKEEFSNATEPLNFLIYFPTAADYDFNLENGNTAEVLNSYWSQQFGVGGQIILRCPIGQEERWEKEGEEKMKKFNDYPYSDDVDVTHFELDITEFGTFTDLAKNEQE